MANVHHKIGNVQTTNSDQCHRLRMVHSTQWRRLWRSTDNLLIISWCSIYLVWVHPIIQIVKNASILRHRNIISKFSQHFMVLRLLLTTINQMN